MHRDLPLVRGLCDRMDEIERQLTDLAILEATLVAPVDLAWLRDALVAMERTYDQMVATQIERWDLSRAPGR